MSIGHGASFQAIFGGLDVRLMGQFHIVQVAIEDMNRQSGPFDERSIIGKGVKASTEALRWASRRASKRNACGVCTARRVARSGVRITLPWLSTTLMVSETGSRGPLRHRLDRSDCTIDKACIDEGTGSVVHENEVGGAF